MNIGIVIPGFSASEADWCIPVYLNLVRELAKAHYVRVFPIRYPYTTEPYDVYGAHVFPFNGGSYTAGLKRWKMLWEVERAIQTHHRALPFDVLHAIWADETGYITNRIGRQINVPTVVSIAGGELVGFEDIKYGLQLGRVTSWQVNQSIKHAAQIVAPCAYIAALVRKYCRSQNLDDEGRLHIVPLGVDTDLFTLPEPEKARPHEFLHVASLNPVKRQDTLLQLIAHMPGTTLDIVGDGQMRDKLEKLARELHIADRVRFHGDVPHDQLPPFYQSARWLLMTSQHEAFCMAAVEALACGVGIIGTAVGVLPEIGSVATVNDLEALLALIVARKRVEPPEVRAQRHERAKTDFSIEQMVSGLVSVYEKALMMAR